MSARGGYLTMGRVVATQPEASYAVDLRSNPSWNPLSRRRWPMDPAAARGRLWKQRALPQPSTARLEISDDTGDSHSDHGPYDKPFPSAKRKNEEPFTVAPHQPREPRSSTR